ncbi:hypothetical protein BV898_02684 [Hypsibius exemplaris]|uniref:Uncharacterized protein n=1 Tax=Hypsibius exemplaris TaxID=2072580 RepID=A0A1W0X7R0_HYPEX|nr:hypothetical protein BV898_02684 [Hypsibius exemplaris]
MAAFVPDKKYTVMASSQPIQSVTVQYWLPLITTAITFVCLLPVYRCTFMDNYVHVGSQRQDKSFWRMLLLFAVLTSIAVKYNVRLAKFIEVLLGRSILAPSTVIKTATASHLACFLRSIPIAIYYRLHSDPDNVVECAPADDSCIDIIQSPAFHLCIMFPLAHTALAAVNLAYKCLPLFPHINDHLEEPAFSVSGQEQVRDGSFWMLKKTVIHLIRECVVGCLILMLSWFDARTTDLVPVVGVRSAAFEAFLLASYLLYFLWFLARTSLTHWRILFTSDSGVWIVELVKNEW